MTRHAVEMYNNIFKSIKNEFLYRTSLKVNEFLLGFQRLLLTGFPCGSESAFNARDLSSIPGFGRPPREGKGYPFQYSVLGIP